MQPHPRVTVERQGDNVILGVDLGSFRRILRLSVAEAIQLAAALSDVTLPGGGR